MKKITSLLMWFCMFVGTAWAQIAQLSDLSNEKAYFLKNANDMGYAIWKSGDNLTLCGATSTFTDPLNESDLGSNWQIISYSGNYYLYNIGAKKFAVTHGGPTYLTEAPTAISIETVTKGFAFNSDGHSQHYMCASHQGHHASAPIQFWTANDNGSAWLIIESNQNIDADIYDKVVEYVEVIAPAQAAVDGASNTLVGAYTTAAVTTLAEKLETYKTNQTTEDLNAVKTAYDNLVANGQKVTLSAGEVFTVKCVENNRGYMVYSAVEGKGSETQVYLAGTTNTDHHAAIDAKEIYKEWSLVEVDGKKYIFNTQKQQFITSDGVVKFSDTGYALNFVDIGNSLWEIQFESNNKYLSYSPGWGADCVRTEGSIDNGCKFYIEKAETALAEGVLTSMENKINVGKLATWKESNLAVLGYVGGYPATMQSAIQAVATYSAALAFDVENAAQRKPLTEGYYYIKGTGVGNGADWYASYGNDATPGFCVPPLGEEKPGIKNIWKFVACDEDGYKLMSCNLNKYVLLENAEANGSAPSAINSEYEDGSKFIFNNQGAGNFIIQDANDNVLRSEGSNNGYASNYWWGEKDETWNIIPATELDITIGKAGYSTTYLPFDVTLPNTVEAYAVTATSQDYATLKKKDDIPANTGAILKGEGTHTLTIAKANSDWDGNLLDGTNVPTNVEAAAYILAKQGENIGFYPVKFEVSTNTENDGEEGAKDDTFEAFKNNANKAYLPASAVPASARFISFDFGGETAIDELKGENGNVKTVIYDLAGRRVQGAQKGIFIVNGKKVIK